MASYKHNEKADFIGFKLPVSIKDKVIKVMKQRGQTITEYMRTLIEKDLKTKG